MAFNSHIGGLPIARGAAKKPPEWNLHVSTWTGRSQCALRLWQSDSCGSYALLILIGIPLSKLKFDIFAPSKFDQQSPENVAG